MDVYDLLDDEPGPEKQTPASSQLDDEPGPEKQSPASPQQDDDPGEVDDAALIERLKRSPPSPQRDDEPGPEKRSPASRQQTICVKCRWSSKPDERGIYRCRNPRFALPPQISHVTGRKQSREDPECERINDGHCVGYEPIPRGWSIGVVMAGVLGAIALSIFSNRGRHYQPGAEVELVGPNDRASRLFSDEAIFMDRKSTSRQFVPGQDVFMVHVSERARVLEDKGDRLQVKVLEGSWKDRVGWVAFDEVRPRPSPEELSGDTVEGLTLGKRREIYAELHRVGMLATFEAEHQVPLRDLRDHHPPEFKKVLAENEAVYEAMEREGRQSLIARYQKERIDQAHLDRIDKEGTEKRWPLPQVANPYKR